MTSRELKTWLMVAPEHHAERCTLAGMVWPLAWKGHVFPHVVGSVRAGYGAASLVALELEAIRCGALGPLEAARARRQNAGKTR